MTLTQLRYPVALSDYGDFSRAAEDCAISQPTLSAHIRKQEEFLDGPRRRRNYRATSLEPGASSSRRVRASR